MRQRLPPASPDREESPTCQAWRSERVRPTIPTQRTELLSPAFRRTSNVTSSTETLKHKTHSRGEGLHHRHTHQQTLANPDQPACSQWRDAVGVSNSIKRNKTKASHNAHSQDGLTSCTAPYPSLVFHCGLLFCFVAFSFGCLLNKCTELICRAMFSSHPAAPHLSELPGIPPAMQLLRVSGNYRQQRLLLLDKRLSFPLVPYSPAVRIKSISPHEAGRK